MFYYFHDFYSLNSPDKAWYFINLKKMIEEKTNVMGRKETYRYIKERYK